MSVKVSNINVINDNRVMTIAGCSNTCKYDDFHPIAVNMLPAATNDFSFIYPFQKCVMNQDMTVTMATGNVGRAGMLLLDTDGTHTPTISGVTFSDGTPSWGDYRYWQIAFQCLSSTTIRAVARGFGAVGPPPPPPQTDIPLGTFYGRISASTSTHVAECVDSEFAGGTLAGAEASAGIVLRATHLGNGTFSVTVEEAPVAFDSATSTWYNTSSVAANLTTTAVEIYENSVTIEEVKIETSTSFTGTYSGTWTDISSPTNSASTQVTAYADSPRGVGRVTDIDTSYIRIWGRATGYNDTLLASFSIQATAIAEGSG